MLQVNIPDVLDDFSRTFESYERALIENDIEALNRLFWKSNLTLRYGVCELLYSYEEIAKFRRDRGAKDQRRTLRNTRITTFGRDCGVANTEFVPHGTEKTGRQSQTWVRTEDGWKIVSAHVSFLDD